mmetsp:Transcript_69857/g.97146  ORF Transcript_69857/g.97146 Transcript_69857/m.97146 type:complete len:216 (+) Transcript_69857:895-1542(+)
MSPSQLEFGGNLIQHVIALFLNTKNDLWMLDKYFRFSKLVLIVANPEGIKNLNASILIRPSPVRVSLVRQDSIPPEKIFVSFAKAITCTPNTNVFDQTEVLNLMLKEVRFDLVNRSSMVRFDAANIAGNLGIKEFNHGVHRLNEEASSRFGALRCTFPRFLVTFRKAFFKNFVLRFKHKLSKILKQRVCVLVHEPIHCVGHITSVVFEHESILGH